MPAAQDFHRSGNYTAGKGAGMRPLTAAIATENSAAAPGLLGAYPTISGHRSLGRFGYHNLLYH